MTTSILILLFILLGADVLAKSTRIVGGKDAGIKDFPYMASIRLVSSNTIVCAGVIISSFHLLSAAHCYFDSKHLYPFLMVYTGTESSMETTSGPNYMIFDVFIHPEYTGKKTTRGVLIHDISIIKVAKQIQFNEFQNKALLPKTNVVPGQEGTVIGWGFTTYPDKNLPNKLQQIEMIILNNSVCQLSFKFAVTDDQVCAFVNKDSGVCGGDSGGPLIVNNEVVGIVSFCQPCASGVPDLYSRVYSQLNFINETLAN